MKWYWAIVLSLVLGAVGYQLTRIGYGEHGNTLWLGAGHLFYGLDGWLWWSVLFGNPVHRGLPQNRSKAK